jgi:hypothetical protein
MTFPAPSATMNPAGGLSDGQRTTITASGFHPFTGIQVLACAGTVASPPKDAQSCEGVTLDSSGYTDGNGRYRNAPGDPTGDTAGYRVTLLPSAEFKTVSIHCGPADPCVLYVGEQFTDFSKPHTFVTMAFKGAVTPGSGGRAGAAPATGVEAGLGAVLVTLAAVSMLVRRSRRKGAQLQPRLDTP